MKTIKIGSNRGNRRLWIEGSRLLNAGWKRGDAFVAVFGEGSVSLRKCSDGDRHVAGTVERPIVDVCCREVGSSLLGERAEVMASGDVICVRDASFTDYRCAEELNSKPRMSFWGPGVQECRGSVAV